MKIAKFEEFEHFFSRNKIQKLQLQMADLSFKVPFWKPLAELNARRDGPGVLEQNLTDDKREMTFNRDCRKFFRVALNYLILILALVKIVEILKTTNYLEKFSKFGKIEENYSKKINQKSEARIFLPNISCPHVTPAEDIFTKPNSSGRVLVAVYPYGPNNQIRGFRESIFLAKMLNR